MYIADLKRGGGKGEMPFPKLGPNEFQEAMWRL